jgi:hypothetical protein
MITYRTEYQNKIRLIIIGAVVITFAGIIVIVIIVVKMIDVDVMTMVRALGFINIIVVLLVRTRQLLLHS